ITMANCRAVPAPTDANYQLRLDALASAISPRTRAIVTVSPNNPSGAVYPEADLRAVNELCRARGLYHIHDEAYEYFTYDNARHFSPASLAGSTGHTISLFSLSKAYGFASWRIGYQVIPAHLLVATRKIQDTILICAPVISQFAALGALAAGREYCAAHLPALAETRALMSAELAKLGSICEVPPADGAFYFLLRVHTRLSDMEMVTRLVQEFGVAVIPGNAFGLTDGCYLRVAYGSLSRDTAAAGINRLARGLRAMAGA
ncbi:MAG TPA: aminotransferase class I/II-fold pyridoxal phosphate-dependent enzyme, partial [Verrucomicrobiae bacterium]|nr:aminotransferase class I/II-fold pyridoxal phosphate-dependent enzyme [Verrucomicrobiae bacterium]